MFPKVRTVSEYYFTPTFKERRTYLVHRRTPPVELASSGSIEDRKEDENTCNRHRAVHGRAQYEVVILPPQALPLLYPQAKYQAHNTPAAIVDAGGRRDKIESAEKQRDVDVLQPLGVWEDTTLENENNRGEYGAHKEEP